MGFLTRLIVTLLGMAFAVLFASVVLCWLILFLVFATVRWLMTGQKPEVIMVWQKVQGIRKGMQTGQGVRWSVWSHTRNGQWNQDQGYVKRWDAKSEIVEDAIVRETQETRQLPKD